MGIAGLILGILSAIGGWIPPISYIAWLLAIIGIILSATAMKKAKKENQPTGIAVAGLVLSIIGLVIALIGLLCTALCVAAAAGAASSFGSYF
jgi:FtsH-binding integral membrane protein